MRIQHGVLGGLLLGLGAAQFLFAMVLGESMAPGYSMHDNAISDLGTIANTRILFNASLVAFGAINLVAGYFFFLARRGRLVFTLFIVGSAGAVGAGLVPLDSPLGMHWLFALLAFLGINLEVMLAARWTEGAFRWVSIVAGVVGLIASGVMVLVDSDIINPSGSIGHGGVERMIVYPALLVMLLYGGRALAAMRSGSPEPAPEGTPS